MTLRTQLGQSRTVQHYSSRHPDRRAGTPATTSSNPPRHQFQFPLRLALRRATREVSTDLRSTLVDGAKVVRPTVLIWSNIECHAMPGRHSHERAVADELGEFVG